VEEESKKKSKNVRSEEMEKMRHSTFILTRTLATALRLINEQKVGISFYPRV
jgi:hypothetical protein